MPKNLRLEDLEVYKVSMEIGEIVWNIVARWPYFEKKTLGAQFVEAADSMRLISAKGMADFIIREIKIFAITAAALQRIFNHYSESKKP